LGAGVVVVYRSIRADLLMSTYRLDKLFSPRSVAVVGASPRETSPARAVLSNLRKTEFMGSINLVNPHYDEI
jgi:acetyltransferase